MCRNFVTDGRRSRKLGNESKRSESLRLSYLAQNVQCPTSVSNAIAFTTGLGYPDR